MGKERKNTAVEQIMDELNEEIQSSLNSSPDLFVSGLMEEESSLEQKGQVKEMESLIHFNPPKEEKAESKGQPEDKNKSGAAGLKNSASKKPVPKKEVNKKNKVKKSLEDKGLFKKKSGKEIDFEARSAMEPQRGKAGIQESNIPHHLKTQNIGSQSNIPMRITLQQSENLRVAQERIVALEQEIERKMRNLSPQVISLESAWIKLLFRMII